MPTEEERRTDGPTGEQKKGLVDKAVDMARERGLVKESMVDKAREKGLIGKANAAADKIRNKLTGR